MKVKKSRFGGPDRWTYDLKYDDGDREKGVKRQLIRMRKNKGRKGKKGSSKSRRKGAMSTQRTDMMLHAEWSDTMARKWIFGDLYPANTGAPGTG